MDADRYRVIDVWNHLPDSVSFKSLRSFRTLNTVDLNKFLKCLNVIVLRAADSTVTCLNMHGTIGLTDGRTRFRLRGAIACYSGSAMH